MKDLNVVLKYGETPVRVGAVGDEVMVSLSDLRMALGLPVANVTNVTNNLPWEVYYNVSAVDLDGRAINLTCVGVTRMGAYMALSKTRKVDPSHVLHLMKWVEKLDYGKLKKGA